MNADTPDGRSMRIAVTGAGGFLGSAIIARLREDGFHVRGLYHHRPETVPDVRGPHEFEVGDIEDHEIVRSLLAGMDYVIHTVSNFRALDDPPEEYWRVNVNGTRRMLEVAAELNVSRFVHCSTIGVHGDVRDGPADETAPFNPGDLYQETKLAAEKLCHDVMQGGSMEVVVVRPCSIFGPGDDRLLKLFKMASKRWFVMIGDGASKFHSIYVGDAADAFRRAATMPEAANQIFIVGQANSVSLRAYIENVAASIGNTLRIIRVPYWPVYVLARLSEKLLAIVGRTSPLTVRRLRFFRNNRDFNTSKAADLLKFRAEVGLADGLKRTSDWYKEAGLL